MACPAELFCQSRVLASAWLRVFGIPGRVSGPLVRRAFSKTGAIGRRTDAAGHGEAILVSAQAAN